MQLRTGYVAGLASCLQLAALAVAQPSLEGKGGLVATACMSHAKVPNRFRTGGWKGVKPLCLSSRVAMAVGART